MRDYTFTRILHGVECRVRFFTMSGMSCVIVHTDMFHGHLNIGDSWNALGLTLQAESQYMIKAAKHVCDELAKHLGKPDNVGDSTYRGLLHQYATGVQAEKAIWGL